MEEKLKKLFCVYRVSKSLYAENYAFHYIWLKISNSLKVKMKTRWSAMILL